MILLSLAGWQRKRIGSVVFERIYGTRAWLTIVAVLSLPGLVAAILGDVLGCGVYTAGGLLLYGLFSARAIAVAEIPIWTPLIKARWEPQPKPSRQPVLGGAR